ncbi:(S)-ureidoglycine aminohydrolase [Roseomonas sp. CCTCC AB2023176]|uniref:(S)-ureidoglycine aminohydrolase n=1 Tax=Roseomonas sp. CCTCC AB2023176 TaxID=3342640 RepID=UPI0035D5E7AF
MRVPTPNPPPGIIGHNRTMLTPHYCVFPPEGIMDSLLPAWPGCIVRFQTTPRMGARFAQALLIMPPKAWGPQPAELQSDAQAFFYVLSGTVEAEVEGAAVTLTPGGYVYFPNGQDVRIFNAGPEEARLIWVRKPYEEPRAVLAQPRPIVGHRDTARREDNGPRWRHLLLGTADMAMDFEMNIMCYQPGAHFWCIETHVMEHGMVMLQGQALQLLGRDWHELWTGDFVWMGPFVPQQIYATGNEVCEYLLYKDVNRDVI